MPARPSPRRPFVALAAPLLALAVLPGCGRPAVPPHGADTTPLARAVRSLRRGAVGDRRFEAPVRPDAPRRGGMVPPSAARGSMMGVGGGAPLGPTIPTIDRADWPARVIPFTSAVGAPATIWIGDTLALVAPPPPDGTPPAAADLRWHSRAPEVATVEATDMAAGVVTARAVGSADIVAWRRVGETVTRIVVLPAVRGRVVAADDAPLRARIVVRATIDGAAWADSTHSAADGTFALRLPAAAGGPLALRVDADDATHAPAFVAGATAERLADVDVVLLPTRWRVPAGRYAGAVVPIDPTIAHTAARDARRLWHVAHPGRGDRPDDGRAVGWAPARLPLPLALDHRGAGAVIGPADSAAFWAIARQLERDWGAPLFRPATLAPGDDGIGGIVATVDPRIRTEGLTTTGWNGDGDLYDAVVTVRSPGLLASPTVVTHELLHALGVGHAPDALASVMHPVGDAVADGRASLADVAYAQLLYAVRARSRPARMTVGVAEAVAAALGRP